MFLLCIGFYIAMDGKVLYTDNYYYIMTMSEFNCVPTI